MAVRGLSNLLSFYHPLQRLLIFCPLTLLFCFEVRSYLLSVCVCLFQVHSNLLSACCPFTQLVCFEVHSYLLSVFVCFGSTPASCPFVVHLHFLSVWGPLLPLVPLICLCLFQVHSYVYLFAVQLPFLSVLRSTQASCLFVIRLNFVSLVHCQQSIQAFWLSSVLHCLSVCLSVCCPLTVFCLLSIVSSLSFWLSSVLSCLSVCLSACLHVSLSVCLSLTVLCLLPFQPFFVYLSVHLLTCLFACCLLRLLFRSPILLAVCLSIIQTFRLFVHWGFYSLFVCPLKLLVCFVVFVFLSCFIQRRYS